MINYTERIALLMQDIVSPDAPLSFIDLSEVLVFARFGRSEAEGAFATCHCLTLPESEPGYYFWRDRDTGELTRRSEWFVTKSPVVRLGETSDQVPDLVRAAALLRSDARAIAQGRSLPRCARLDRQARHRRPRALSHRSGRVRDPPDRARRRERFDALARPALLRARRRHGEGLSGVGSRPGDCTSSSRTISRRSRPGTAGIVSTTFRNFPSFPQRYMERLEMPSPIAACASSRSSR